MAVAGAWPKRRQSKEKLMLVGTAGMGNYPSCQRPSTEVRLT
jgi:hypothetical protein